ncbi:hypothetical protein [Nocardia farcinica]|uniref:hypothetical protein n=1 Tax=Nocardia farcinica TaxID=37329 RepID=UPI0018935088|nr:hypothetical protein [Nocardia farcinica]MBF6142641.1 hypothetical protein [Nocardia farcinica]MBF6293744.1 hypothetical protein [Nocardia farcinica]MBF6380600.1 hypothetical protein [Nocardia farcinica]
MTGQDEENLRRGEDVAGRMWRRLLGRGGPAPLDPDRTDLVVLTESFDDAEACSAALARATGLDAATPAVLRHHLRVPAGQVERVCAIAAQDGYSPAAAPAGPGPDGLVPLRLHRVQPIDALHCSQERSRMAGLAQRHDGHADGWQVLAPAPPG